ncbi:MAG: fumarylacetoacetate hydrolase family protein [Balneolaceae bacterium]
MKLIRFGKPGMEKPGIIRGDGKKIDVSGFGEDYDSRFFGKDGITRLEQWLSTNPSTLSELSADQRLAPPVKNPGKIVCVGLNYEDHAREGGMKIPEEPILFFKSTTALSGPYDDVIIPKNSRKTDWEVELAVIIGHYPEKCV